jgi:hypothetical protein
VGDDSGVQIKHARVGGQLRPGAGVRSIEVKDLGREVVRAQGKEIRRGGYFGDRIDRRYCLDHCANRDGGAASSDATASTTARTARISSAVLTIGTMICIGVPAAEIHQGSQLRGQRGRVVPAEPSRPTRRPRK